ncbi:MAG: S41 family peptidase [Terriglobia bacterium]
MCGKRFHRHAVLSLFLAGSTLFCFLPLHAQGSIPADEVTQQSLRFAKVYEAVQQNYMDPLDPDRLILEGAIRGMLASLDPFSSFFDHAQFMMLQEETRGEALGFGSILYVQPGKVMVIQTEEGSPSWRAGLGPGEQIVAVNGVHLDQLSLRDLVRLLRQARSHPVQLSVLRPGDDTPQDIRMTPAEVKLPTVDIAFPYSPGIGYIHVASFEAKTPQELVQALKKLDSPHLTGLILDLRNNPGGLLASALDVCSLFLKPGAVVLTVRGRSVAEKTFKTVEAPLHVGVPLIVLVNRNTASAAEVVAAALQDHDRALILGEPTFGKGVVESVTPLSGGTGLALLTAEYFAPSGRCVQKPLPGTALDNPIRGIASATPDSGGRTPLTFHTDDGRPVSAAGGITPDVVAPSWHLDPWLTFLSQTGMFASFASEYFGYHSKIDKNFEVASETLQEFRNFLVGQRIRTPQQYWTKDQGYLKVRLKQALFNLAFGLDAGNEVETVCDPQVKKAASLFPDVAKLLQGPGYLASAKR